MTPVGFFKPCTVVLQVGSHPLVCWADRCGSSALTKIKWILNATGNFCCIWYSHGVFFSYKRELTSWTNIDWILTFICVSINWHWNLKKKEECDCVRCIAATQMLDHDSFVLFSKHVEWGPAGVKFNLGSMKVLTISLVFFIFIQCDSNSVNFTLFTIKYF